MAGHRSGQAAQRSGSGVDSEDAPPRPRGTGAGSEAAPEARTQCLEAASQCAEEARGQCLGQADPQLDSLALADRPHTQCQASSPDLENPDLHHDQLEAHSHHHYCSHKCQHCRHYDPHLNTLHLM